MDNWLGLLLIVAIGLVVWVLASASSSFKERQLVRDGILPPPDKTTDDDIARLVKSGHKVWAIKRYRQLHNVSLKDAKTKIEAL
jgi:ribosomal protein L7/L12